MISAHLRSKDDNDNDDDANNVAAVGGGDAKGDDDDEPTSVATFQAKSRRDLRTRRFSLCDLQVGKSAQDPMTFE